MASYRELKVFASSQYSLLIEALKVEKALRPETYEGAASVGETIRKSILNTGLFEELEPLPKPDPPKK